MIKTPRETFKE